MENSILTAALETHNGVGIPILDIHGGELSAQSLGELFYFFELSAALTAQVAGRDPFAETASPTVAAAMDAMGKAE